MQCRGYLLFPSSCEALFFRKLLRDQDDAVTICLAGKGRRRPGIAALRQTDATRQTKLEPIYDPLRDEPRFQELLRRAHHAL